MPWEVKSSGRLQVYGRVSRVKVHLGMVDTIAQANKLVMLWEKAGKPKPTTPLKVSEPKEPRPKEAKPKELKPVIPREWAWDIRYAPRNDAAERFELIYKVKGMNRIEVESRHATLDEAIAAAEERRDRDWSREHRHDIADGSMPPEHRTQAEIDLWLGNKLLREELVQLSKETGFDYVQGQFRRELDDAGVAGLSSADSASEFLAWKKRRGF